MLAIVTFILFYVLASSAFAAETRPSTGLSFGPDGAGGTATFENLQGVAIDPGSGDVFAYDAGAGSIYKFDADGVPVDFTSTGANAIEGVGGAGAGENEIAVAPPGSPAGTAGDIYLIHGPGPVQIFAPSGVAIGTLASGLSGESCGVAVDPAGHVFVGTYPEQIAEYVPSSNPPTEADLNPVIGDTGYLELCNVAADGAGNVYGANYKGAQVATLEGIGDASPTLIEPGGSTLATGPIGDDLYVDRGEKVAVYDSTGQPLYSFGVGQLGGSFGIAVGTDGVYAADGDSGTVKVFGSPVPLPSGTATPATEVTGTKATLNGLVNPDGIEVENCLFEYGETTAYGSVAHCEGAVPTNSAENPVQAKISGLESDGTTYHYRVVAENEYGAEPSGDETLTTTATVLTEGATAIGSASATLNGTVRPEDRPYTACEFEYGLTTTAGFEQNDECEPEAGDIPGDFSLYPVELSLEGLQQNAKYKFRLNATNSAGTVTGETLTFSTGGAPLIGEIRARDASQNSATLEARIDPRGFDATYVIEWGLTASYGNIAGSGSIGSGEGPTVVSGEIGGLSPGTIYHYRVRASSEEGGDASSPDQTVETLDFCGLPAGRCFELVSPPDAGSVGTPGKVEASAEMLLRATPLGSGGIVYETDKGLPGATSSPEVLYHGIRGQGSWSSAELSPPLTERTVRSNSISSISLEFSKDLSCGVWNSSQLLTDDPGTRRVVEAGGGNLYRRNSDGSYSAVTTIPIQNPGTIRGITSEYEINGLSRDCSKVVFSSVYHYAGVAGAGDPRLYEWDEGTLRNVGIVPGPSGEQIVEATGVPDGISEDGTKVFFTAISQTGNDSGHRAVFVRLNGSQTLDISQSPLAPDTGASYQSATSDGSRVFFTANAGLTAESSSEGTDLYEYDLLKEELVDLSVTSETGGAEVAGVAGASADGSTVFYVARGQLVPGVGKSLAENQHDGTYSIYAASAAEVEYVGTIKASDTEVVVAPGAIPASGSKWSSWVSPDGRFLLFESSAVVTGYDSGGPPEVYLYDSDAPKAGATVCVSCRQDGAPSDNPAGLERVQPLPSANEYHLPFAVHGPRALIERSDEARVLFSSRDNLAFGAAGGAINLYEWAHGQVVRLATEPLGIAGNQQLHFGSDADGTDVYITTPERLTWEDRDERSSVYDARIGGGFPQPPAPPSPCNPIGESSCQGAAGEPPSVAPASSSSFVGPGNPKAPARKKHHKKKHHQGKHKHKQHHNKGKRARHANASRRAGK